MNILQKIGIVIFLVAMVIFTLSLGWSDHTLNGEAIYADNEVHRSAIEAAALEKGLLNKTYSTNLSFIKDYKDILKNAQVALSESYNNGEAVEGIAEWDYKIGDWKLKDYTFNTVKNSASGWVPENPILFFFLTFGLSILGGIIYMIPMFQKLPGIKHDGIYHNSLTRGLTLPYRKALLILSIIGLLLYGVFYMNRDFVWPVLSLIIICLIIYLVMYREKSNELNPQRSASPTKIGWIGLGVGLYFIGFYILLYWRPEFITNWIDMVNPISLSLSGNPASQWFLYGMMYTIIVLVMGIRMIAKYRHNKYQIIRTISVIFFQTAFAFLLPEILVRMNQPWYDFKNIWPLNYTFFFDWNIDSLMSSGALGIFMFFWGIALIIIAVPVITYFYGKRWYCSWVCGCGGLAETLGDPYRQLSDKSLRAWQFERYIIHGVLVVAIIMTAMVIYTAYTGSQSILFLSSDTVRGWYGFLIGSAFAGIVGTGFYPLMGNRVWCRFGCPLAAYLGLVQKFKSRFRITVNGSQCISCGNCSTYCEMGIDVRWYAQRGQDVVRSSCVGCGVCAAVCPRGVLRLENGSLDIDERTENLRTVHIDESMVKILD